jgi:acyl-CoA thioesterase FadM
MDLGRLDLMLRSGLWRECVRRGWYPVVAGQTVTYRRSLKPGQRFELHTRIVGFDGPWSYVEQVFAVGTTVYAQAVVRARFLHKSGGVVEQHSIEELAGPSPDDRAVPEWMRSWTGATKPLTEYRPA